MLPTTTEPTLPIAKRDLERLCHEAKRLIFIDFEAAWRMLDSIHPHISDLDTGIDYRLCAGFLETQRHHYPAAEQHFLEAIEQLEGIADPLRLADVWLDLAAVFANQRLWEKTENAIHRADNYLKDAPDQRIVARLATRQGYYQMLLGHDNQALEWFIEAEGHLLELADAANLKDYYFLTLTLGGMGELYQKLNEREKSVEAFLEVLRICKRHDLRPRLGWHYHNGGRAKLALNQIEEAAELFQNAIFYAEDGDLDLKASAYANQGITAFVQGEFARAIGLLDKGSALFVHPSKPEDFNNLLRIEAWKAKAYIELGFLDEAESHFEKAVQFGERGGDLQQLVEVCSAFASLRAEQEKWQEAYAFQRRAADFAARHAAQIHSRELQELETRHQLEKNRQEARLAKLRLTGLQLRALRAQMNPHFLFNALNAIQGFITSGKSDEAERYLARFAKLMRRTLDYSDREVVSLETEIEFLENYLDLNRRLRFQDKLQFIIHLPDDLDADDVRIPTMIVQPFVENAIEHGLRPQQGGTLHIAFDLTEDETCLRCTIEDDGLGYNRSRAMKKADTAGMKPSHKSRGMDITQERLELLHEHQGRKGERFIKITDLEEKTEGQRRGTRVEVLVPVYEF